MAETRGAATIVDRVEGWGHDDATDSNREDNGTWGNAAGNSITATDASKESTATRVARALAARKTFKEAVNSAIVDRQVGYGGTFDPTGGADAGYGRLDLDNTDADEDGVFDNAEEALADPADEKNGVFYDETGAAEAGTGSNTARTTTDTEALATGRTADSRNTVLLNDGNATRIAEVKRTSIVDRSTGWGHEDGSLTERNDA